MRFVNDLERPIGTYLYGRRMYETMVVLGDRRRRPTSRAVMRDYAEIWRAADKIVFSRTLERAVERADADRARVRARRPIAAAEGGGRAERSERRRRRARRARPSRAGLVDELHLFVVPGAGRRRHARAPRRGRARRLELLGERRFRRGAVHLHYRVSLAVGPGLDQAPAGFEQVLREHLHVREDGHEVRVTSPTGDNVQVDVIDDAGAGDAAEVPAEVVALRPVDLAERGDALDGEPVDLERLLVRKPGELADVPVRGDQRMAGEKYGNLFSSTKACLPR